MRQPLRILITGMSRMQAGISEGLNLGIVEFSRLMSRALTDAGHHVENRPVAVGEPLGEYDVVLAGISPTSTTGRLVYSTWDAIARARAEGCALCFYVDDHKLTQIRDTIRSDVKQPTAPIVVNGVETTMLGARLVKDHFAGRADRDWAIANLPTLVSVGKALAGDVGEARPWPTTIIPAHPWGNHDLIVTKGLRADIPRPVFVDPSAYALQPPSIDLPWEERKRAWVSATLPDKKLSEFPVSRHRVTWPVHEFGEKDAGQARISELEAHQWYQRCMGVVATRRIRHDGSGWWRIRYTHAAQTNSLVLASAADTAAMGGPFHLPVETIESMSDAELQSLAHAQSEAYFARQWSREQFRDYLDGWVRWIAVNEHGPVTR